MNSFTSYEIVSIISILIIISYIFSLISKKIKTPSVLLLLIFGVIARQVAIATGYYIPIPDSTIQLLGIVGLILVLLEAGLDLKVEEGRGSLIKSATLSSLFVIILSMISISSLIHYLLNQPWSVGLLYSVPLGIISSTVVASSVSYLSEKKREFLTYESSLSDIFGILIFNYILIQTSLSVSGLITSTIQLLLSIFISFAVSLAITWLMIRVNSQVKVFLVFAILILLYAMSHGIGIPALPLVLIFGLVINNWSKMKDHKIRKILPIDKVNDLAVSIKSLTVESAFLARTFFFALFGYSIDISRLLDGNVIIVGALITVTIFIVRYLYLFIFSKDHIFPEFFYAPRGLVTIVLFYQIPKSMQFSDVDNAVLMFVILATSLMLMAGSIFFTPHEATKEADDENKDIQKTLVQVSMSDNDKQTNK